MRSVGVAVVTAVLAAGAASASIDAEVPPALKAKSSIAPSGETETFRFAAARRSLLSLQLASARGGNVVLGFNLRDSTNDTVDVSAAVVQSGPKTILKDFELPESGDYRLEVSGEGTGDYTLTISLKGPRPLDGAFSMNNLAQQEFDFAAPANASVSIVAKTAPGSPAQPRLVSLDGDLDSIDLTEQGKRTATSHAVTIPDVGPGGELTLLLENLGPAGDIGVTIKVKPKKLKAQKRDFRGTVLGHPGGGESYLSRIVGSQGGTVGIDDSESAIDGAQVVLPGGALPGDTEIGVSTAPEPPLGSADDQAAGPAVDLQPSGILFDVPVAVTLPFDPALLPVGADGSDLRVLIVEDNGSSREVEPDSVDAESGLLTVSTSGFSVCIPIVERGTPRVGVDAGGDEFWLLGLNGRLAPGESGDSRSRWVGCEAGVVSFFGDLTYQFASTEKVLSWSNFDDVDGVDGQFNGFTQLRRPDRPDRHGRRRLTGARRQRRRAGHGLAARGRR
jgi:hypothetical protein